MLQGTKDYLKIGDHNAWCQRCGMKYKASELKTEWTGFRVCSECLDMRHPQEFIKSIKEVAPTFHSPRNDGPSDLVPLGWTQTSDQAGSTYFVPFGMADKDSL